MAAEIPEILARLTELGMMEDSSFLTESLDDFTLSVRELLVDIDRLYQGGNVAEVARSAHQLAGASVTLGADRLGRLAGEIERLPLETDEGRQRFEESRPELRREADRVLAYCGSLIAQHREAPSPAATIRRSEI